MFMLHRVAGNPEDFQGTQGRRQGIITHTYTPIYTVWTIQRVQSAYKAKYLEETPDAQEELTNSVHTGQSLESNPQTQTCEFIQKYECIYTYTWLESSQNINCKCKAMLDYLCSLLKFKYIQCTVFLFALCTVEEVAF